MPRPTSEKGAEISLKGKQMECQALKYGINERNLKTPINILENILLTLLSASYCIHIPN